MMLRKRIRLVAIRRREEAAGGLAQLTCGGVPELGNRDFNLAVAAHPPSKRPWHPCVYTLKDPPELAPYPVEVR